MKNTNLPAAFIFLLVVANASCKKENTPANESPVVIEAAGDIQDDVDAFRNMLGTLNTTPDATGGRREISWDGVPDSLNETPLPANFFNQTGAGASASFQKGVTYSASGSFMVSNDGFASINVGAAAEFTAFSGSKTFANVNSALWEVGFQKAGTTTPASVQSFGAVFADVDKDSSTSLEFFDGDKSLGKYFVPAHDAATDFSFFGISFSASHITKVQVSHDGFLASGALDISEGGTNDLIVLDDFIYSEPVAQ